MTRTMTLTALAVTGVLATGASVFAQKGKSGSGGSSTSTAQSVMVTQAGNSTFTFNGAEVWAFNAAGAQSEFTNALLSGPAVTCNGSTTNCAVGNQPTGMVAPDPSSAELTDFVEEISCIFFDGGDLPGTQYTQEKNSNGLNGRGNWTFTWTYAIAPRSPQVGSRTYYQLEDSSINNDIRFNGFVAALSALSKTDKSGTMVKYSFSLTNTDSTGATVDRISNLEGQVFQPDSGGALVAYGSSFPFMHAVLTNAPGAKAGDSGALDFLYGASPGQSFGTTAILPVTSKQARDILNTDSFLGNDDGGADGKALQEAAFTNGQVHLPEGLSYVRVTGNIKGNGVTVDTGFSATFKIRSNVCG